VHVGGVFERFLGSFRTRKRFELGAGKSGDLGVGFIPARIDAGLVSRPDYIET